VSRVLVAFKKNGLASGFPFTSRFAKTKKKQKLYLESLLQNSHTVKSA